MEEWRYLGPKARLIDVLANFLLSVAGSLKVEKHCLLRRVTPVDLSC